MQTHHILEVKWEPSSPKRHHHWWGWGLVEHQSNPCAPWTLAVRPPVTTSWAMSKSTRDHCSDSELCCLWTRQADAFQGMYLYSLPDWSQAMGPIPSISAISPEPRVSEDLPWTSMLVSAGGTRLHSPRGPFCPHRKRGYLICCNMPLGCSKA